MYSLPYLFSLGSNPVYKTRVMASNALVPLVSFENASNVVKTLLFSISPHHNNLVIEKSQNKIHGAMLQLWRLVTNWLNITFRHQIDVKQLMRLILNDALWVLDCAVVNPISKRVLLEILIAFVRSYKVSKGIEIFTNPLTANMEYTFKKEEAFFQFCLCEALQPTQASTFPSCILLRQLRG